MSQLNTIDIDTQRKQRIEYFDIVKGFAILCIILGHLGLQPVNRFVFTFHVPLFLIISGYFFNPTKPLNLRLYGLIKPYITTVAILIVVGLVIDITTFIVNKNSFIPRQALHWLVAGLYGSGSKTPLPDIDFPIIGAIWFLLAMAWGTLGLWCLLKLKLNVYINFLIVTILAFIGHWSSEYIWLPFSIQSGMGCILFIYVGYFLRANYYLSTIFSFGLFLRCFGAFLYT